MERLLVTRNTYLPKLRDKLLEKDIIGFDTETGCRDNNLKKGATYVRGEHKDWFIVGIAISTREGSYYLPLNHREYNKNLDIDKVKKYLKPVFADESKIVVAHNLGFDRHVLKRIDISIETKKIYDTLTMARMLNQDMSNNLENVIEHYLGVKGLTKYDDVVATVSTEVKQKYGLSGQSKAPFDSVDIEKGARYAIEDTEYLIPLYEKLDSLLEEEGLRDIYYKYMPEFSDVLYKMEKQGINIDLNSLNEMSVEMEKDLNKVAKKMENLVGLEVNYNSSIQLSELLYNEYTSDSPCDTCKEDECNREGCEDYQLWDEYGHKNPNIEIRENSFNFPIPERTDTGQPSSGKSALKRFKHYTAKNKRQEEGLEFIKTLLNYKKISKLKSTFVDGLKKQIYDDGKVHGSFNLLGASSGRLSSSSPNLQNLPSQDDDDKYRIRQLFTTDNKDQVFLAFDYSSLETRVLAELSGSPNLLDIFERGVDSHGMTACLMFDLDCHPNDVKEKYNTERKMSKTLGFGQLVG